MARPPRIEFENAWCHVMNRGAGRRPIFTDDNAHVLFLALLSEISSEFRIEIHAYCLMNNHYHFLIRTPYANLNLPMQKLSSVYTRQHNRLNKTDGPLFKGRYKAILIAEEAYLAQVSRYIHRNLVEAKLVQHPRDYPWSSYPAYCDPVKAPKWLHLNQAVMQVSPRCDRNDYLNFVENPLLASMNKFYHSKRLPGILGSKEARRLVENNAGYHKEWQPTKRPALPEIMEIVGSALEVSTEAIMLSKRGNLNVARAAMMYLAQDAAGYPASEIAACLGIGSSGVTQLVRKFKEMMAKDSKLLEMFQSLRQLLSSV